MATRIDIHTTTTEAAHPTEEPHGGHLWVLSLAALGVVYGDIGTSPLYAMRECFHGPHAIAPTPENVLGVLSLIFWSLIIVISIKYLVFVLRADNRGEGGILALTALATPIKILSRTERRGLVIIGIFGAALLYGDGIITPAVTVLSAVEGLNVATPVFESYVVPITLAILVALFLIQNRGTAKIGKLFGPVMLLWFVVLAALGVAHIVGNPGVLASVIPTYGFNFFVRNGWIGFLVLGTVFLVVTGGEALYADMGHFGRRPIRLAWFVLVLPALMLNYFGQGALLIARPELRENPFYHMAPDWALLPMVALATAAGVIASQALISGAFSISMQGSQLGFIPRLKIDHTSSTEYGQIYIPIINWALMVGCIIVVLGFGTSSRLAAAYGVAVTSTMVITTLLFYVVMRDRWKWSAALALPLCGFFLIIDAAFFGANIIKVPQGGWFPLVIGGVIFTLMMTWKKGRRLLAEKLLARAVPLSSFMARCSERKPLRVSGTAVFMNGSDGTPPALLHNLEHNKVLHEHVVVLTVKTKQQPHIEESEPRVVLEPLGDNFWRMVIYYGFMEDPDIPKAMKTIEAPGVNLDPQQVTFFLGRETLIPTKNPGMALWREKLFALMSRNSTSATTYFCLPPDRVVEMGSQVEI